MNNKLLALNIICVVTDTIIAALAISAFGWSAWNFGKWWLTLFSLIPLALFNQHSVIIDADIQQAKVDALKPKGGEDNGIEG